MDTTTPMGTLVFQMLGAQAGYERGLIRERVLAGAAAARGRSRQGGRPRVMTSAKPKAAQAPMQDRSLSIAYICLTEGVSRNTLYR